jgi:hypothetical protein
MLSRAQKARRLVATAIIGGGLLVGTAWGTDDHFPFGPFRMYSISTRDRVTILKFRGVTEAGSRIEIPSVRFGMRRAELDGQRGRMEVDPSLDLMPYIAESYRRFNPNGPELRRLEMYQEIVLLDDSGRPVSTSEETVAEWTADG